MKTALLILCLGDSIRMGWNRELHFDAPSVNCHSSVQGAAYVWEWSKGKRYDAIVFNFGIWDCKLPRTPIAAYQRNLNDIIDVLEKRSPRLYFCTTTPGRVNEVQGVYPEVVEEYNRAALEVMKARGVSVIDLHALCLRHREWWYPENVHYTDEGYKQMAEYVKHAVIP